MAIRNRARKTPGNAALSSPRWTPSWTTETPLDLEYSLRIWSHEAEDCMEEVEVSRDEFISVKSYLATMRGYNKLIPLADVAKQWGITEEYAYRLFCHEHVVLMFPRGKRPQKLDIRIPESVLSRAEDRLNASLER